MTENIKQFLEADALLPCPFCGGQASERNSQYAEGKIPWPTELWHVGCDACHVYFMGGSQVSIAKDRWNTRTPDHNLLAAFKQVCVGMEDIQREAHDREDGRYYMDVARAALHAAAPYRKLMGGV